MSPQQVTTESAPIEEVERTNMAVVRRQEQEQRQGAGVPLRWNPYAIDVMNQSSKS